MDQAAIQAGRRRLAGARRVAVLSGAGISAESGVPTFRGPGGLWESHRPEDLATPQAFARDPALVWRWYHWRRELIAACHPNPAHLALARFEPRAPEFRLITQNVDGLHCAAGSRRVLEIHGSLWRVRCLGCGQGRRERRLDLPAPPLCPACGGLLRPDVVWFGESLDQALLQESWRAASESQVMLVVGTSALMQPAASLAQVARRAGSFVIEVNLDPTPNTGSVDLSLLGQAGDILPRLLAP